MNTYHDLRNKINEYLDGESNLSESELVSKIDAALAKNAITETQYDDLMTYI